MNEVRLIKNPRIWTAWFLIYDFHIGRGTTECPYSAYYGHRLREWRWEICYPIIPVPLLRFAARSKMWQFDSLSRLRSTRTVASSR